MIGEVATTSSQEQSEGTPYTGDQLDQMRDLASRSLYIFTKGILGYDWLTPHIHRPLCKLLQDDINTRVRITLPRGWLKSTICSIALPIWLSVRDPNIRVLIVQNTFTNACKKLAAIKSQIEENELFRLLWPEILPDKGCTWKTEALCLKRAKSHAENTFEAAGTRTKVTSRHYDVIIQDDTVAPDLDDLSMSNMCPTKDDVEQAIGWHRLTLPLLVNPTTSRILLVGTRWFMEDLLSWNQENEPDYIGYTRYSREKLDPVEDEQVAEVLDKDEEDPESPVEPLHKYHQGIRLDFEGDDGAPPTYPERFDETVLRQLEASLGPYMYSCLYMNTPVRSDEMTFQMEWFQYYDYEPERLVTYTTVDSGAEYEKNFKGDPDWNVVATCGKDLDTGRIYCLDIWRKRCTPSELIAAIFDHVKRWHPVKVGIEAVAYQKTILYWVNERMRREGIYFNTEPLTHGRVSKNSRIRALQPVIKNGDFFIRRYMGDMLTEFMAFPLGAHDDIIDTISMQLQMWAATSIKKRNNFKFDSAEGLPLEGALWEITSRQKKRKRLKAGLVMDVFDPEMSFN